MNLTPIDKIICIDFDNTIIPWEESFKPNPKVYTGVPEAVRKLRVAGYYIVIFTSRMSQDWFEHFKEFGFQNQADFAANQFLFIKRVLDINKIHWDKITAEKIPARCYFDDKAINVRPGELSNTIDTMLLWGLL